MHFRLNTERATVPVSIKVSLTHWVLIVNLVIDLELPILKKHITDVFLENFL